MINTKNKKQEILELVKNTTSINTGDYKKICDMQDLLNVTVEEAEEIMKGLDREGKRRLLWIITSVSGYDTFEFWLKYGILEPYAEKIHDLMEKQLEKEFQKEFAEINKKHNELINKEKEVVKKEKEVEQKAKNFKIIAEQKAGDRISFLRQQVKYLQKELEQEKQKNKKAKRLLYLLEKI